MQEHVKIGEGGRIIVPVRYRKALNLHTGDELIIQLEEGEIRLFKQGSAVKNLQSLAKQKSKQRNHTDAFLIARKKDSE